MKVRVVYQPNGKVAVIHPAPKSRRPDESENEWLERVFDRAMQGDLKGLPYDDIDVSSLPQTREDRNAWEGEKGKGISINLTKAQEHRNEREKRELIEAEKEKLAVKSLKDQGLI